MHSNIQSHHATLRPYFAPLSRAMSILCPNSAEEAACTATARLDTRSVTHHVCAQHSTAWIAECIHSYCAESYRMIARVTQAPLNRVHVYTILRSTYIEPLARPHERARKASYATKYNTCNHTT